MAANAGSIRFYRHGGTGGAARAALDARLKAAGVEAFLWQPGNGERQPSGFMGPARHVYRAFHAAGIFSNRDFGALCLRASDSGALLHVSWVFPGFFRFPFMARNDLQIGATHTVDDARGRGLARLALSSAVDRLDQPDRSFWYLTESANTASCKVAEAAGFSLQGTGSKHPRLGLKVLGGYRLDQTRAATPDLSVTALPDFMRPSRATSNRRAFP